jgi:hypothetical protein
MNRPIGEWWVVEWAGGEAFEWHTVSDIVQRNGEGMMAGESARLMPVALVQSPEDAQCVARDMKRLLKEKKANKTEEDAQMIVETMDVITMTAGELQRAVIEAAEKQSGRKVLKATLEFVWTPETPAEVRVAGMRCVAGMKISGVMKEMRNGEGLRLAEPAPALPCAAE